MAVAPGVAGAAVVVLASDGNGQVARTSESTAANAVKSLPSPPRLPLTLQSAPKYGRSGNHRVVAPRETCRRARAVMKTIGVTRLADVTGLDHVGIPVWAAV